MYLWQSPLLSSGPENANMETQKKNKNKTCPNYLLWNERKIYSLGNRSDSSTSVIIGVCTDTYVFCQSVLEKKTIWSGVCKGRNAMSQHNNMSQPNVTDVILQNDVAGPTDVVCSTDTSGLWLRV